MADAKALLFDLDGTLADTAGANHAAYAASLLEVGVHIERDAFIAQAHGRNWRQFLPDILLAAGSAADPAAIAERKLQLYRDLLCGLRLNEPLLSLLSCVRPFLATGLVTTASRGNAEAILRCFNWTHLFDVIVTGSEVMCHKPHPEAYLLAASILKIDAASCVAFEDSDIGIESARAAGMQAVRVIF